MPRCLSRCPTPLQRRRPDEVVSADEVVEELLVDEDVADSLAEVVTEALRGLAGPRLRREGNDC